MSLYVCAMEQPETPPALVEEIENSDWLSVEELVTAAELTERHRPRLQQLLTRATDLQELTDLMVAVAANGASDDGKLDPPCEAAMILSVRMFHSSRACARLYATGNGMDAAPILRQLVELLARMTDILNDESGERARRWIAGDVRTSATKTVQRALGEEGIGFHDRLSASAHADIDHIREELIKRVDGYKTAWTPMVVFGEDEGYLDAVDATLAQMVELIHSVIIEEMNRQTAAGIEPNPELAAAMREDIPPDKEE